MGVVLSKCVRCGRKFSGRVIYCVYCGEACFLYESGRARFEDIMKSRKGRSWWD